MERQTARSVVMKQSSKPWLLPCCLVGPTGESRADEQCKRCVSVIGAPGETSSRANSLFAVRGRPAPSGPPQWRTLSQPAQGRRATDRWTARALPGAQRLGRRDADPALFASRGGTAVSVELKHGDTVSGIAKWIEDGLVGIAFDQPIDVVALLTSSEDGPQPRMPRIELNCTAWVREDADIYRTRTLNISQGGMCVEGDERLRVDTEVIVSLAGLGPIDGPGQMEGRRPLRDRVQPGARRQRADGLPSPAATVRQPLRRRLTR